MATLHTKIHQHVAAGATLHTDEAGVYRGLGGLFFNHETVNHSEGEYVRDNVTTNGVESVFAVMKRGLIGVYHHASKKHLGRYVDEFAFRLNEGDVKRHTMQRLDSFIDGVAGKRLTYKALIVAEGRDHCHAAGTMVGLDIDTCAVCGRDIRDPVHAGQGRG